MLYFFPVIYLWLGYLIFNSFFYLKILTFGHAGSLLMCGFFSSCGKWGYFLVVMHKLLIVVTPLVGEARALGPVGTVGAAPGL